VGNLQRISETESAKGRKGEMRERDTTEKKNSREADLWEDPGRDQSGRN